MRIVYVHAVIDMLPKFQEILRSETSKGIPFASVLTIMSYRFIDISTSLT